MKALIHVLALCALLLFHVPIVTGYYYGLTNPWNWFGNWHSAAHTAQNVSIATSTVPRQMEQNVTSVLPSNQNRSGKAYSEVLSSFEHSRIMKALIGAVGNISIRNSKKSVTADNETVVLANQLSLGHHDIATTTSPPPPITEYAEASTTFTSVIIPNSADRESRMPSTETIRSRQSIVSENAPYLGIFTTLASYKEKQLKELFATTVSPVKSSTEAILLPDYVKDSSPSLGKERVDKTSGFSTDSVDSFAEPTTAVSPLKGGFLYSHLKNRLQVSTTADYDQTTADLSTPATSVEDITDSAFPSNERFPKQSELNSNSESSTTSSRKKGPDFSSQAVTTSANIESIVVTPLEIASSSITTTSSSNIDDIGLVTTGTNWSPESAEIQSTTVKSSLAEIVKGESSVSEQEEVATENPTKQFIRELIALKERQGTLSTGANSTALSSSSEPSSFTSGSPLTTASSISSDADETHTSISVEVNTRSSISSQGPLFFFFTTTRLPAVDDDVDVVVTESSSNVGAVVPTEPTFERENRMLPFAFYNNQAVGKPVDEGHFVSSFQDFYSDTDIFKGMMPVYVSKITNMTNNVEMNSYWLGNNNVK